MSFTLPAFGVNFSVEPLAKNIKSTGVATIKVTVDNPSDKPFNGSINLKGAVAYRVVPSYSVRVNNLIGTKSWIIKIPQEYTDGSLIATLKDSDKVIEERIANVNILRDFPAASILYLVPEGNTAPGFLLNNVQTPPNSFRQYVEIAKTNTKQDFDFGAYDFVVLNDISNIKLTDNYWKSLRNWIEAGGVLVLSAPGKNNLPYDLSITGYESSKTAANFPLLEKEMGVNLPRGSVLTTQLLIPSKNSKVLYESDGVNWIIEKNLGQGKIIAVPVEFTNKTFAAWQGSTEFWRRVVKSVFTDIAGFGYENPAYFPGDFIWALSSLLPVQMPETLILVIIFTLYVLLVGFLSYFILKRYDKRGLMWVTIPALALIFFTGTYFYGASKRSNQVLVAEIGRINLFQDFSLIEAGIGVFVPSTGTYQLTIPGNYAFPIYNGSIKEQADITISDNSVTTTFKDMPVWSMQSVASSLTAPAKGLLQLKDIAFTGKAVNFTLTNNTDYDITDAFIGQQGAVYYYLPRLKRGESAQISLSLDKPKSIYELMQQSAATKDRKQLNARNTLIQSALNNFKGMAPTGWTFVGFTAGEKINCQVNGEDKETITLFMVRQSLIGLPNQFNQQAERVKYQ